MRVFFPGSFDPPTLGHLRLIERILPFADEIVIGVGDNPDKHDAMSSEERVALWHDILCAEPWCREGKIRVVAYAGLTVLAARQEGCSILLRGARTAADWSQEVQLAMANRRIDSEIETIVLIAEAEWMDLQSTMVRQFVKYGLDLTGLVPEAIRKTCEARYAGTV